MSHFANLMALSATQTKQAQSAVEVALRDRERREAQRRKEQAEREAKEREMEKQRRLRMFEDQKKEEERRKKKEEEEKRREELRVKEEERRRIEFLHGKKASRSSAPSSSAPKERSKRRTSDDSDEDSGPIPLTREELRQRKLDRQLKMSISSSSYKRSSTGSGYRKGGGQRLPGGALDVTTASLSLASSNSSVPHMSVKDRLAAMPNMLVKLNQNKRDTRTIDEIMQDRAKAKEAKTLAGVQAQNFTDWFPERKKEGKQTPTTSTPTLSMSSPGDSSSTSMQKKSAVQPKAAAKPISKSTTVPGTSSHSQGSARSQVQRPSDKSAKPPGKQSTSAASGKGHAAASSSYGREREREQSLKSGKGTSSAAAKNMKRPRSLSRSESPRPGHKKRHRSYDEDEEDEEDDFDVKNQIWKIFGRNRSQYVSKDVFSDDEDMEADARAVEREELLSARIAAKEEQKALEEERRHEEEKRRRKKERERAAGRA